MTKQNQLDKLKQECNSCQKCVLGSTRNNIVFSDGSAEAKILLIGEAPGADEDATGTPFVGRAGKLLTKLIEDCGFSRKDDFYICNTVKCRPPENRVPTNEEKALCEKYLLEQIKIVNPKVIVLCGATSAKSFLGDKIKISQIRGQWYKLFDGIDATVIFHPSYLLRNHSEAEGSPRWLTKQDLYKIKKISSR
ncbi:MAG: uracil-DNA glycosylase [Candidatus Gastranaerophilales bacterium]|nr:uracil-DNA glycosylase [Candidatus Gastranaerophilales bacterium]